MHGGYNCDYVAQILVKQVYWETFHSGNNQKKLTCVQFNSIKKFQKAKGDVVWSY